MKTIKFRAWDTKEKEMLEDVEISSRGLPFNCVWDGATEGDHLDNNWMIPMQFTGLYDKNGKEIYEGDLILIAQSLQPYKVVWEEDGAYFRGKSLSSDTGYALYNKPLCKVIGNIWENPELIGRNM